MSDCSVVVLLATFPDDETASRISTVLVEQRLVACVNVLPRIRSIYRWNGEVQSEAEVLVMMKTRSVLVDSVVATVKALHPYEVPEVIALPVVAGLPAYLQWVESETQPTMPPEPAA